MSVRASPKASRNAIEGERIGDDGRAWLAVKLTAPPSDGAANEALIALLAKSLGVPKRDVALASGATSRLKRLHITGDPAKLAAVLKGIIGDLE